MAAISSGRQIFLWTVAACIGTTALVGIAIWETRPHVARHVLYVTGSPERGSTLFFGEKQCGICHSVNGAGGRVAPDLGRIRPGRPAMGWLATVLWNHAPGMWRQMRGAKSPVLNQEEMADILAFLYQAGSADRPGDVHAGQRVFSSKGCARCHSVGSIGGDQAPDLSKTASAGDRIGWIRAMWNHAHSMMDPIQRELGQWPQFRGDEMTDLIAFTGGQSSDGRLNGSASRGWQYFQEKCMQCHAVRGKGGSIGPELGPDRDLPTSASQFAAALWNHAPAMLKQASQSAIAAPTLEGNEIADILAFLTSLRYFEPVGSPFLGEKVFTDRGCARCHGARAEGTGKGPKLRADSDAYTTVSLATALWSHGPAMWTRAQRLGIPWPTLEGSDMGDLISFLNDPARK